MPRCGMAFWTFLSSPQQQQPQQQQQQNQQHQQQQHQQQQQQQQSYPHEVSSADFNAPPTHVIPENVEDIFVRFMSTD